MARTFRASQKQRSPRPIPSHLDLDVKAGATRGSANETRHGTGRRVRLHQVRLVSVWASVTAPLPRFSRNPADRGACQVSRFDGVSLPATLSTHGKLGPQCDLGALIGPTKVHGRMMAVFLGQW